MIPLSENAKAILLLTAPLIVGRGADGSKLLTPGEYRKLAQRLHDHELEPSDLLGSDAARILDESKAVVDIERAKQLLGRGLQLSQAVERWHTRAIWVVSRADPDYPTRLKARLRGHAPSILYGCGDLAILNSGGLAVVGSRHAGDELEAYAMRAGELAASADRALVSGGARGIDQAAMRGAAQAGGRVCGVLADSLEKQVMIKEHRDLIMHGQLTLVSPFDPNAGFNAGNAMQRNKVVYALADAALVVSSDVKKGGTWTGAIEQLDKFKHVPVYVRSTGPSSPGLGALLDRGAQPWPNPETGDALQSLLDNPATIEQPRDLLSEPQFEPPVATASAGPTESAAGSSPRRNAAEPETSDAKPCESHEQSQTPEARLFAAVRAIVEELARQPIKDIDLADALNIQKAQAKAWLTRLVDEGVLEKSKRPAGYKLSEKKLI